MELKLYLENSQKSISPSDDSIKHQINSKIIYALTTFIKMKKNFLLKLLAISILTSTVSAQNNTEIFCKIISIMTRTAKFGGHTKKECMLSVDYRKKDNFSFLKDTGITYKLEKVKLFDNEIDALNYIKETG